MSEHTQDSSADPGTIGPPSEGIHEEVGENEIILYLEATDRVVTLNETGSAIWTLCDGSRTIEQLVAEIASAYQTEQGAVRADVETLLDELTEAGFLPG